MEEHRRLGGNPDVDVAYQYLGFLLEDDETYAKLAQVSKPMMHHRNAWLLTTIEQDYRSGELSTAEMKELCIDEVTKLVLKFQEASDKFF